eukprot:TRINITY_DN9137_c0_g1_i1.p1 TRINITY_DN9137_c0_g1~~TRINITY_DN9137_c0_g1_i1.p1  ORF type:complete len:388 (+),score=88.79 TRINITY_DN9137_c0_g1_i1:69-1166(+)
MSSGGKYVPRSRFAATVDGDGPPRPPPQRTPARDAAPAADQGRQGLWTGGASARSGVFSSEGGRRGPDERPSSRPEGGREPFWNGGGGGGGGGPQRGGTTQPPAPTGHNRFQGLQHGGVQKYQPPARPAAPLAPQSAGRTASGQGSGSGPRQRQPSDGGRPFSAAFSSLQQRPARDRSEQQADGDPQTHDLSDSWAINWRQRPDPQADESSYAALLKPIADFSTVEDFWSTYMHLQQPDQIPVNTEFTMFRSGVQPIWEDPQNIDGGKFQIRLQKGYASEAWEDVVLHTVGCQFEPHDEVAGCIISVRPKEDVLSIWTRNAADEVSLEMLGRQIKSLLAPRRCTSFGYKRHSPTQRAPDARRGSA